MGGSVPRVLGRETMQQHQHHIGEGASRRDMKGTELMIRVIVSQKDFWPLPNERKEKSRCPTSVQCIRRRMTTGRIRVHPNVPLGPKNSHTNSPSFFMLIKSPPEALFVIARFDSNT
jgi:hypothetical protein